MLTVGAARARLESMLQWQAAPALSSTEVDQLLAMARRPDPYGNPPDDYLDWKASTAHGLNVERAPTIRNGFFYRATTAGTSGATEPAWPVTVGATVNDGSVVWTNAGLAPWSPTWNLRYAAAEGWDWKAGKVVNQFDVRAGSTSAARNQQYQACIKQAQRYRGGAMASLPAAVTLPRVG